jgi:hypothetical protein
LLAELLSLAGARTRRSLSRKKRGLQQKVSHHIELPGYLSVFKQDGQAILDFRFWIGEPQQVETIIPRVKVTKALI